MTKREELTNPASCMSRAADDEMTFVLLGRDAAAPLAILAWITERVRLGKNKADDAQITEALECANRMVSEGKAKAVKQMGQSTGIHTDTPIGRQICKAGSGEINRELLEALKECREVLQSCAQDTAGTPTEEFFKSKVRHCDIVIAKAERERK